MQFALPSSTSNELNRLILHDVKNDMEWYPYVRADGSYDSSMPTGNNRYIKNITDSGFEVYNPSSTYNLMAYVHVWY